MENNQKVTQQLYQFQYLKDQRDYFEQQLQFISASRSSLMNAKSTLENIKEGVSENDEILVPIGGVANIKATIKDIKNVLLYVGRDVVIEKKIEEAFEYIETLIEQHNKQIEFLRKQLQNLDANLQGISQGLQGKLPQN